MPSTSIYTFHLQNTHGAIKQRRSLGKVWFGHKHPVSINAVGWLASFDMQLFGLRSQLCFFFAYVLREGTMDHAQACSDLHLFIWYFLSNSKKTATAKVEEEDQLDDPAF